MGSGKAPGVQSEIPGERRQQDGACCACCAASDPIEASGPLPAQACRWGRGARIRETLLCLLCCRRFGARLSPGTPKRLLRMTLRVYVHSELPGISLKSELLSESKVQLALEESCSPVHLLISHPCINEETVDSWPRVGRLGV